MPQTYSGSVCQGCGADIGDTAIHDEFHDLLPDRKDPDRKPARCANGPHRPPRNADEEPTVCPLCFARDFRKKPK